jgi:hypothetical protein
MCAYECIVRGAAETINPLLGGGKPKVRSLNKQVEFISSFSLILFSLLVFRDPERQPFTGTDFFAQIENATEVAFIVIWQRTTSILWRNVSGHAMLPF